MKPKIVKVKPIIRGDTPKFEFPITLNGEQFDLTGWNAYFTCTPNAKPVNNNDAVVALAPMTVDEDTASYQWTKTITSTLSPGTTYYFDVQVNKDPVDTNNFTVIRGQFEVVTDFGIGAS